MSTLDLNCNQHQPGPLSPKNPQPSKLKQKMYSLSEKIAKGSFSTVHFAEYWNGDKKEKLACKVVDQKRAPKHVIEKRLPRELSILSNISHPNVVGLHSVVLEPGPKVYICMRNAEHGNLKDFLHKNGFLPEKQARIWFRQILQAVDYVHNRGMAHLDLKLENVLLSRHWNIKLADFGFARSCVNSVGNY